MRAEGRQAPLFEIRALPDGQGWWYRSPRLALSGIWKGPLAELEESLRRFLRRQEGARVTDEYWLRKAALGARTSAAGRQGAKAPARTGPSRIASGLRSRDPGAGKGSGRVGR